MRWSRAWLLMILVGATALGTATCGGSSQTCAQGTERCPCYGNGSCNSGLTCASNTCVSLGGAGGASGGGGQAGTIGSGATGGSSKGGTGGTGTAGTGGAAAGGSGGSCTNTSTDPMNCGHVCKNADPVFGGECPTSGCCVNGVCGPSPGTCITNQSGFTTCADYCASIGETCIQQGCPLSKVTWEGYVDVRTCQTIFNPEQARNTGPCDTPIGFNGTATAVRCCCTDTH
jgi:hypothetical protein